MRHELRELLGRLSREVLGGHPEVREPLTELSEVPPGHGQPLLDDVELAGRKPLQGVREAVGPRRRAAELLLVALARLVGRVKRGLGLLHVLARLGLGLGVEPGLLVVELVLLLAALQRGVEVLLRLRECLGRLGAVPVGLGEVGGYRVDLRLLLLLLDELVDGLLQVLDVAVRVGVLAVHDVLLVDVEAQLVVEQGERPLEPALSLGREVGLAGVLVYDLLRGVELGHLLLGLGRVLVHPVDRLRHVLVQVVDGLGGDARLLPDALDGVPEAGDGHGAVHRLGEAARRLRRAVGLGPVVRVHGRGQAGRRGDGADREPERAHVDGGEALREAVGEAGAGLGGGGELPHRAREVRDAGGRDVRHREARQPGGHGAGVALEDAVELGDLRHRLADRRPDGRERLVDGPLQVGEDLRDVLLADLVHDPRDALGHGVREVGRARLDSVGGGLGLVLKDFRAPPPSTSSSIILSRSWSIVTVGSFLPPPRAA